MPTCSKAPRGLFVLSWETRIFTGPAVSPGPLLRQRPSRYSFRAGRNLPDKEFRYLRTVRVTAAVYRGFSSRLRAPLPLTVRHWAGVSPYTSASAFAETGVFGKQSLGPVPCGPRQLTGHAGSPAGAPLLPKVRGQFAEFLSKGSPDHLGRVAPSPPVSVCGTVGRCHTMRLFSTSWAFDHSRKVSLPSVRSLASAPAGICPASRLRASSRHVQWAPWPTLSCPHLASSFCTSTSAGAGMCACCPSPTLNGPRLRTD